MQISGILLLTVVFASGNAGHLGISLVGPGTHGIVLQGPSSKTSLLGPDGSHISGVAAGGTVVAPALPGGVVSAAAAPGYVAGGHAVVGLHGVGLLAPGAGHEGEYIPDYTEHLYDDGSYKGDHYDGHY